MVLKKKIFFVVIALLTLIITTVSSSSLFGRTQDAAPSISHLYVFGDSLSDVGNLYRKTAKQDPPQPYFQGRFSNGQLWVEYLASKLALGATQRSNFAYGGAMTGNNTIDDVPGVLAQIQTFLQNNQKHNQKLDSKALYIIWAGANDYFSETSSPQTSVANLTRSISLLANAGAKRLLVGNLPDLGQVPQTRTTPDAGALSYVTKEHNQLLSTALQNVKLELILLDVAHLYREVIASPAQFGFKNVTTACLNLSERSSCWQPDQFLFWDGFHPTTKAHQIIGDIAFKNVQSYVAAHR